MAKKTKEEIRDMVEEISKKTTDVEIRRLAYAFGEKGAPVDDAIRLATVESQRMRTANVENLNAVKNEGRHKVKVTLLSGPAEGRTTEYWNDVAERMERKGLIRIDGKL